MFARGDITPCQLKYFSQVLSHLNISLFLEIRPNLVKAGLNIKGINHISCKKEDLMLEPKEIENPLNINKDLKTTKIKTHIFCQIGIKIIMLLGLNPLSHHPPMIAGVINKVIPPTITLSPSLSRLKASRLLKELNTNIINRHL